ncbi:MAG TPA: LLM class flavin-dependent oxidoreductase [Phycicoccus sp.]|jgi:alkanesulfonate monooxygenase SsuD/methylene tetrahydromethanopterin reductase-like flavin-dependent oxidoreductase (luciferase family)|nr:LLM class flavin-dependent oxidoreductase [Phycicoccus sp.]HQK32646.1 LLM class flavin-dependent oxidoreductase [Phycicoccus sp.]HQY95946.1 LLM class flavin-dependent oxidoreductase [Phycicoccus sp.]HRA43960.1 LLM class flavin-dependent oxidoreductase [Phycicoccus sp.]
MTDYGRPLEFGWFAGPDAGDARALLDAARVADRAGLDLIGVQDHPYNAGHLDAFTLLSAMAAVTGNVRLFPDVANLPLRGPVMIGRAISSLDVLSQGRAELGLGTGVFWDGIAALGGTRLSKGESVDALEEALTLLRGWFDAGGRQSLTMAGSHYPVTGAHAGPAPAHRVGIWLGARGPRMLHLLGTYADGWLPSLAFVPPEQLADLHARIDDAALAAGRAPSDINRIYNVWGAHSPQDWVEMLTEFTLEHGMNSYVFGAPPTESALRTIGEEIAPAVREAVATARG